MESTRKICLTEPEKEDLKYLKKQNVLVYDKAVPYCRKGEDVPKKSFRVAPTSPTNLKRIRVCTGADMKRMCAPTFCDCGTTSKRRGFAASFGRLLGFGLKGAVAGGFVYWTYEIGLWGKPEGTERLYVDICSQAKTFKRETTEEESVVSQESYIFKKQQSCDPFEAQKQQQKVDNVPQSKECQQVPSIRENVNCFKTCWNRGVLQAFSWFSAIEEIGHIEDDKVHAENENKQNQGA